MPKQNIPIEVHATPTRALGMPPARFLRDYWQKRPLLVRGAFPGFTPSLQPDDLAGLACMDGVLARIVTHAANSPPSFRGRCRAEPATKPGIDLAVPQKTKMDSGFRAARGPGMTTKAPSPLLHSPHTNDGNWNVRTGPFDDATFAKLPESHWTLLVQDVDKWDPDTAGLLDPFAFIPRWRLDDVMVSYATDGGGVGAHVDQYDVFLMQGLGQRRWSIDTRPNPLTDFRPDVELKLLEHFSPTNEWTLDPGDMLYLPPGVPHDGVAVGECMTFSVGMRAPAASELLLDLAEHVAEALPETQRYADPDLVPAAAPGEIDDDALRRARHTLGPIGAMLDDKEFADWFGGFVTRYRCAQVATPRKRAIDPALLATRLSQSTFRRDAWTRFAWRRKRRGARLYVAGTAMDAPIAWARELASGASRFDGARLAQLPHAADGIALLAALIDAGHVTYRSR